MAGYNAQLLSALAGGGANGGAIQSAIAAALQGQNKANAANEQRYQQGLTTLQQGHTQASGLLQSASDQIANNGQAAANRINLQEQQGLGSAAQSAVSRGLTNTTISDALNRGVSRDANDARLANQEAINTQQSQIKAQQANEQLQGNGSIASFIAARNDTSPDLGLLSSLVQGAASNPAGAQRSGSITRNAVPGLGASASSNGLPSAFGGSGGGGPAGYFTNGGNSTAIPGVTPQPQTTGSVSSALAPAMSSGTGTIASLLAPQQSYTPSSPNNVDTSGDFNNALSTLDKFANDDTAAYTGSATTGYYTKAQWDALSPEQQTNVLAGRKA